MLARNGRMLGGRITTLQVHAYPFIAAVVDHTLCAGADLFAVQVLLAGSSTERRQVPSLSSALPRLWPPHDRACSGPSYPDDGAAVISAVNAA